MALNFGDAVFLSVFLGVFFGLLLGVRYLVRIETQQRRVLEKILKVEELVVNAEKKILSKIGSKKKK